MTEKVQWLWGVVLHKDGTFTVVPKRYRGPWATSALNRARKECKPDETYTVVHGDTFEDAVAEATRNQEKGYY